MTIGVVFGGKSYEHEISIVSCVVLSKVLNYDLKFIFLDLENDYYLIENKNLKANYFSSKEYKKSKKISLDKNGFCHKSLFGAKKIQYDFLLNLIHGAYGEEGIASAFFDFYNQYYIGPRIEACAISYNKYMTKIYAKEVGVNTLKYELVNKQRADMTPSLDFPIIVKPCRSGSSMGINIAKNEEELSYYMQEAFDYDDDVLLEPYMKNVKEYNLAGYFAKEMFYSNIEEPEKGDILDFEKKYMDFARDEKLQSANISKELEDKLRKAFSLIYSSIFKGSIIRCDFFVINDEVYINEINPIPGSMAHYLFDDFNKAIDDVFYYLPKNRNITLQYDYIDNINKAKG